MNKEEILNTFLLANIPEIITQEEFDDVKKAIKELQQENQELKRNCNIGYENLNFYREESKKYKEVFDKAIEYINENLMMSSILDGKKYYTINNYSFDYRELLDILKEVE